MLPGTPINLYESWQQRFNSSGLAASAAGMGTAGIEVTGPEVDPMNSGTLQMSTAQIAYFDAAIQKCLGSEPGKPATEIVEGIIRSEEEDIMTSNVEYRTRTGMQAGLVCSVIFVLAGFCFSQPAISLSPKEGPPTTSLRVSGSGFAPNAKIDIYFGTHDEAAAMANGKGSFLKIAILAPASALPGSHWVSAVERSGQAAAQARFLVRTNWLEFRLHNMERFNRFENVLNVHNVGSLQRMWSFKTGAGVYCSPAVANGVVYAGSYDGNVYALDASTGAKLWSHNVGNWVYSSPAVANGVVYVGVVDGNVDALNAKTGALLWSFPNGWYSTPTVAHGKVYVGSFDGTVYALNAKTGTLLWSYTTGSQVWQAPAVANGVVYVPSEDNNVYALDASTGAKLWSYATGSQVVSSPAIANGVVYVSSEDNNVYALDASAGALLWSYNTGSAINPSPAVANGVVYVGSDDGIVHALNASTGAFLWSYTTGNNVQSSPAVANGVVYIGSMDHNVYALDASTGAKLWSYATGGAVTESSPAVANGVVYVGSLDHKVYAFGLKNGLDELGASSKRPDLKMLLPDFNLKVSQPAATFRVTQ